MACRGPSCSLKLHCTPLTPWHPSHNWPPLGFLNAQISPSLNTSGHIIPAAREYCSCTLSLAHMHTDVLANSYPSFRFVASSGHSGCGAREGLGMSSVEPWIFTLVFPCVCFLLPISCLVLSSSFSSQLHSFCYQTVYYPNFDLLQSLIVTSPGLFLSTSLTTCSDSSHAGEWCDQWELNYSHFCCLKGSLLWIVLGILKGQSHFLFPNLELEMECGQLMTVLRSKYKEK